MGLTLNALTALRVIRAIRSGAVAGSLQMRCDLIDPDPSPATRWTKRRLASATAFLQTALGDPGKRPLDVLVSSMDKRLQAQCAHSTFRTHDYPPLSFIDLGNGIAASGPELTFVELARIMDPAVHLLLGMELCGRFSRDVTNPRSGEITYGLPPVTSVERLRAFAHQAHWIRGAEQALATIDAIVENAWSPMEALVAALIVLPHSSLGYDLWPITLNPRKALGERLGSTSDAQSRVSDIMFAGTSVGLNYDGEDHFRLQDIADAAMALDQNPQDAMCAKELETALAEARARIVADKRRDRDLMAMGLFVFSITKEDLEEPGGFDRVMLQVIEAIEASGTRNLCEVKRDLERRGLATARQDFIWSLMPGGRAMKARRRLELRRRTEAYEIEFELQEGQVKIVSTREL